MLLIRTTVAPSPIQGVGLFAAEDVASGTPIWEFAPGLDLVIPLAQLPDFPAAFRAYLESHAYLSPEFPDAYVLSCDHAKFMNHSETPNTALDGRITRARGPIRAGEEITCDYRLVVLGWTGFV